MSVINDFFFVMWDKESNCHSVDISEEKFFTPLLANDREHFCDYLTIAISVSSGNIMNYLELSIVRDAFEYLSIDGGNESYDLADIHKLQCSLLLFLLHRGDMQLNREIIRRIARLQKASVIDYDLSRSLTSILMLIKEKKRKAEQPSIENKSTNISYYDDQISSINGLIQKITGSIEDERLRRRLAEVPKKIKEQRFSIGITGVMNAGKSTMLNALLGSEILGTAVVPETANLTIIKYSEDPKAVVHFWNSSEWRNIEESAEVLEGIQKFVSQTREHFSGSFDQYISPEGESQIIKPEELPLFTSVERSDKKCNLVKSVELYTDLEFVKNGVEIVDTPGLDDPVIQREEITTGYLLECDLLCHLMNVNQSATQKDIEFIIESLLYQNIAQILIVITRIDTVTENELRDVIEYTAASIKSKLESIGKGNQFSKIIKRIEFIPISGKMALLHRTNKKSSALQAGYDLQKSGIPELEDYLRKILFGKGSIKAQLIIEASNKEINSIINAQTESYEYQKEILGRNIEDIKSEYKNNQKESEVLKGTIMDLDKEIISGKTELEEYLGVLEHFVDNRLNTLLSLLKRRIMDDVRYELRKNKRKPTEERISTMLDIGIRDGFTDMLREYRHLFQKRVEEIVDRIEMTFDMFDVSQTEINDSAKELFERYFDKLFLAGSNTVLENQINRAIARTGKKDLDTLDTDLQLYLEKGIRSLKEKFQQRSDRINSEMLSSFESRCKGPAMEMKQLMESRERVLQEAIEQAQNSEYDSSKRAEEIESHLKLLAQARNILKNGESR